MKNASGLDRLQYGWGGAAATIGAIHAVGTGTCLDVPGQSNQQWTLS